MLLRPFSQLPARHVSVSNRLCTALGSARGLWQYRELHRANASDESRPARVDTKPHHGHLWSRANPSHARCRIVTYGFKPPSSESTNWKYNVKRKKRVRLWNHVDRNAQNIRRLGPSMFEGVLFRQFIWHVHLDWVNVWVVIEDYCV